MAGLLDGSLGVHPTFFYESFWNLVGLAIVYYIGKHRKFDGQCFLFYFFWYGLGRAWIEGLRTDPVFLRPELPGSAHPGVPDAGRRHLRHRRSRTGVDDGKA